MSLPQKLLSMTMAQMPTQELRGDVVLCIKFKRFVTDAVLLRVLPEVRHCNAPVLRGFGRGRERRAHALPNSMLAGDSSCAVEQATITVTCQSFTWELGRTAKIAPRKSHPAKIDYKIRGMGCSYYRGMDFEDGVVVLHVIALVEFNERYPISSI